LLEGQSSKLRNRIFSKVFFSFNRYGPFNAIADPNVKYQFLLWLYDQLKPVYLEENNCSIYNRGDRKWEIYFLHHGQVEFVIT
jgi:hypothetical protein